MSDWYSRAREEDGRTDDEIIASLPPCPGCKHPKPDPHKELPGGAWCVADMTDAAADGGDPMSVGPCY